MKRILFFGDSLTAGHGLANPRRESLPALIQKKIDELSLPFEIINAGISGDTSSGGLGRVDYWISKPVDIFVLELGVNDLLRGVPLSSTKHNLDQILKRVLKRYPACKIVVMGMEVPQMASVAALDGFRKIYKDLAALHNTSYIPFFLEGVAGVKHLNMNDGLHPTAKGYEVIADKVWSSIQPLILSSDDLLVNKS